MRYELECEPFPFDFDVAYRAEGYEGIAWRVDEYEGEITEESEWTGYTVPTGRLLAHMVGDDRTFAFDREELTPISDEDYCPSCGQIGCGWH